MLLDNDTNSDTSHILYCESCTAHIQVPTSIIVDSFLPKNIQRKGSILEF